MKSNQHQRKSWPHDQHHQSQRAILENAGVDTYNYFSLRIDKCDLPDNAELVIQVRDKSSGKLVTLNANDESNSYFGKKSRFYGKIMADGHIFNPYIHRRFIASQFRDMVKCVGVKRVEELVAKTYDWTYALEQVQAECHKLAMLQRRDKEAYEERRHFFTLQNMKDILKDYVLEVFRRVDDEMSSGKKSLIYLPNYGQIRRENVRPFKFRFTKFLNEVKMCGSYGELEKVMENFEFLELQKCRNDLLPSSFTRPYVEAGAFYTLKHAIMFEGMRLDWRDQSQSLDYLLETARMNGQNCLNLYAQSYRA